MLSRFAVLARGLSSSTTYKNIDKLVYTAHVTTTGGREGAAKSSDGLLDVKLSKPKEMGGNNSATNPEQLFAAGYSACFMGAMQYIAGLKKVKLPTNASIDAKVHFGPRPAPLAGFGLGVDLFVNLPGVAAPVAADLVKSAHEVCPYSNATRGNIDVNIHVK
jgi:osmotically inducible protein OsmC